MESSKSIIQQIELPPTVSAQQVADTVKEFGVAVLRQALDRNGVEAFHSQILQAFAELDARRDELSEEDRQMLDRMEMPVPDRDNSFRTRIENYHVLNSEKIVSAIETLQGPFGWHYPPQIRRQNPQAKKAHLPYHQDASYMKDYKKFIICWTPLTACGEDAPGLEVAIGRVDEYISHSASGLWEAALTDEQLKEYLPNMVTYAPMLEPGDVILFDERTLHRTYLPERMTKTRISIDFRAAPLSILPPEVRAKRKFVEPRRFEHV